MLSCKIFVTCLLFYLVDSSTLTQPPQSALVIGFEKLYEQSLLAYTLSDQTIDSTLIVSANAHEHLYENLRGIEVLKLNTSSDASADKAALDACEALLSDQNILKRVREIQPTFVIFPALRYATEVLTFQFADMADQAHDACLLPWSQFINSIPVIVTYGPEEDLYAVQRTQIALPINVGGLWSGFWLNAESKSLIANTNSDYVAHALKVAKRHMPELEIDFNEMYSRVELVLSSHDRILRADFALLGEQPVGIGCHHCRGSHPLPAELQKQLVEFRLGTIVTTLEESFAPFIQDVARNLPQGRQGLAVAWKNRKVTLDKENKPDNLFIHREVDRQDLIGYPRARVLLSHCEEMELLEAVFHGTPTICFPRDFYERANERRGIELGFAFATNGDTSVETIVTAIDLIHKTTSYREVARSLSSLIRDSPLPTSDRLVYWLGYAARNADREIKLSSLRANEVRTLAGDSQVLSSFLVGVIIGAILTLGAIFVLYKSKSSQKQTRNKDKRFDR